MNEVWKTNPLLSSRLKAIGNALDAGHRALVFDGGLVGINDERESEVISNVAQGKAPRPSTRPREGRRATSRTRGRSPGEAEPFRSGVIEAAYGVEFRLLAQHYEALAFEDKNGLWVVARTRPLGSHGPQVHLLVGAPVEKGITPRAWAFDRIGHGATLLPLKHTNFPDASICAFTKVSGAWSAQDGLLPLIDHYSLWVTKSWHRTLFGSWPGPQVGACALYRRKEFASSEWCGCDSGRRYAECHQGSDVLVSEKVAQNEFHSLFSTNYEDRQVPACVLDAARLRWKRLPTLATVFAFRHVPDERIAML